LPRACCQAREALCLDAATLPPQDLDCSSPPLRPRWYNEVFAHSTIWRPSSFERSCTSRPLSARKASSQSVPLLFRTGRKRMSPVWELSTIKSSPGRKRSFLRTSCGITTWPFCDRVIVTNGKIILRFVRRQWPSSCPNIRKNAGDCQTQANCWAIFHGCDPCTGWSGN